MRHLVPVAVLLLTVSAVASALRPALQEPSQTPAPLSSSTARAMWVDPDGQTLLLVEGWRGGHDALELHAIDAAGGTAWRRELGEGWLSALAEGRGQLFIAVAKATPGGRFSRVLGVDPSDGSLLWTLSVEGEITDLLADPSGGLRARSLHDSGADGTSERVLGIQGGVLRWERSLDP